MKNKSNFKAIVIAIISLCVFCISCGSDGKNQVEQEVTQEVVKSPEELKQELKEKLEMEIKSIEDGIDFSSYHKAQKVEELQIELILFSAWWKTIKDGSASDDKEINNLSEKLKNKVVNIQAKEFPILRKRYSEILHNLMWEHDIYVTVSNKGNNHINITGGIFAANKNIKEFQDNIHSVLKMFRFNQSRYRWYKGASEYTYYTIFEGKDTDEVVFK
ncbi:MAG: hypothetical protein FWC39_10585 [Bacteroidetes bacterium]|nr:hypothetical protein [Bacteroidota bacterium]